MRRRGERVDREKTFQDATIGGSANQMLQEVGRLSD